MSNFFRNARRLIIGGGNFTHIEGDQNTYHIYPDTVDISHSRTEERTEFDEFYHVKRGAICKLKDVVHCTYPRRWDTSDVRERWEEGLHRADRTVCVARILREPGAVFTVVQYSGPEVRKAFTEDFAILSKALTSDVVQIYGHNQSEIPSLIFYNELVPIGHIIPDTGILGLLYIWTLSIQFDCRDEELWMDPARGNLCRGPVGPSLNFPGGYHSAISTRTGPVPSAIELLQEDIFLRFLANSKSNDLDHLVISAISLGSLGLRGGFKRIALAVSQPTVFSTVTNEPIAIANQLIALYAKRTNEVGFSRGF
ncbi:hypothetical protein PQX77_010602 [Marasmius sp. AFHP31]|nr:hypothetical protein PQX77_010602 [Marasmius sp. AFHP31]